MTDINNINNTPDEPDEEETGQCYMCGAAEPVSFLRERDNRFTETVTLCDACDEDAITCESCGTLTDSGSTMWVDDTEEYFCEPCAYRHTSWCDDHDRRYLDGEGCSYCGDDDYSYHHGLIRNYTYKPNPEFFVTIGDSKRHKTLRTFTGFELEMEATDCDISDGAELADQLFGEWTYLKSDGSLNNGFEMVSHPLGYEFAMNEFPWEKLNQLSRLGMRSANTRTCGLHIHINRNIFDTAPTAMYRFMSMFYRNADKWKKIAGRSESTYANWSEYELDSMLQYTKGFHRHEYNHQRYVAINLQNRNTLELRFFKGTLRPQTFIARIEAAHAVAHYAHDTRNRVNIKASHDWERFREWTIQNKYLAFDAYATEKGV